jgi:hypothetical protein
MLFDEPGIRLNCPAEAESSAAIPVEIEMAADARTYWDNNGILDHALTVALVRRDAPGLRFLPKIDPNAIMLPDEPLPGRPSEASLDADRDLTVETKVLDAGGGFGALHDGAAEYHVAVGFSKWWAAPRKLRVRDRDGRVRGPDQPVATIPVARPIPTNAREGVSLALARDDGRPALVSEFRIRPSKAYETGCWLTILGLRLNTRGGASGGVFRLVTTPQAFELIGRTVIPLSALAPAVTVGKWVFLAFIGDETSAPLEVSLGDGDVESA